MPDLEPTTSAVRFHQIKPGYRIGDDGTVWSRRAADGEWRQLKPTPQYRGHMAIWLGRKDQRFVHRLVLEAFVGPCPDGMECRHLDGNPGNNRLDNLAWGTRAENQQDAIRHGAAYCVRPENIERMHTLIRKYPPVKGEKHHRAKLTDEQVEIIRAVVNPGERDGRAKRLAEIWGVSLITIRMIARGIRRTG